MTRRYEIFNSTVARSRYVVVISMPTFIQRHGPSALRLYRLSKLKLSKSEATRLLETLDRTWEHDLYNLFEAVFVNKCTAIKNADSLSYVSIK